MRWTSRFFLRDKAISMVFGLISIIPLGATVFFSACKMSGFELLYNLVRIQYLINLGWMGMTIVFMRKAEANDLRDCIDTCTESHFFFERSALIWILFLWIIWNVTAVLLFLIGSYQNDAIICIFENWFWRGYLINILLPQLICILVAAAFVLSEHRIAAGVMLIFYLFLVSSFREQIVWQKTNVPVFIYAWNVFQKLFHIFYQNAEWSPDVQYGLQTETSRLELEIGWILLVASIGAFRMKKRCSIFKRNRFRVVIGFIGTLFFALSLRPASVYRLTQNFDGAFADRLYYKESLANEKRELQDSEDEIAKKINQQIETSLDEQKSRTWQVKAYELTVNLGRMLDVEAVLTLDAEADTKFCFTLYHGYQVKSVTSLTKDVSVSFTQGKDLLVVQTDRPTNQLKILISYSGYANRFYANSQAAMLPGWFAWYPMAGDQAIFETYQDWGNGGGAGYNPYARTDHSYICLQTNQEVATNLKKVSSTGKRTRYEGMANAITIVSGNLYLTDKEILEEKSTRVVDLLSAKLEKDTTLAQYTSDITAQMEKAITIAEQYTGEDYSDWRDKKILLASEDLCRNDFNNEIAVFDDSILIAENRAEAYSLLTYFILEDRSLSWQRKNSSIISNCLLDQYFEADPSDTLQELIESLERRIEFETGDVDCNSEVTKKENEDLVLQDFLEVAKRCLSEKKAETFLQRLVAYERNPKLYESDEAFLRTISEM